MQLYLHACFVLCTLLYSVTRERYDVFDLLRSVFQLLERPLSLLGPLHLYNVTLMFALYLCIRFSRYRSAVVMTAGAALY